MKADWLHEFGGSYAMTMTNIGGERVRVDAVMAIPGLSTVSARHREVETTIFIWIWNEAAAAISKKTGIGISAVVGLLKTEAAIKVDKN
ncbi:MAG: hypothetical protein ACLR2G_13860 [Phascolarctobacterium faecium]